MHRFVRVLVCAAAVPAALLLGSSTAQAGTYSFDQNTSADSHGWWWKSDPGYVGCSRDSRPGACADVDVPKPTALRLFMKGSVAKDSYAVWRWDIPGGMTLVSGSVDVAYAVTADTRVYMRAWLKSEAVGSQPKLFLRSSDGSGTWTIPGGQNGGVAVYLEALAAHSFTDKWQNTIRIDRFSGVLRDDTAPVVEVAGPLANGSWQSSAQPVCLDVSATDAGSGVKTAELVGPLGAVLATDTAPGGTALQPGDLDYEHSFCISPASLGDGERALAVRVTDVAGEVTSVPVTVRVDAHAPALAGYSPSASTPERQPAVSFSVDAGPSGLAFLSATLDGMPMNVSGSTASLTPAAALAYGQHTVSWTATDLAGNTRDAFWTFQVVDTDLPQLSEAVPAAGSGFEDRRPQIGFRVSDPGSGIDPSTLRVLLDGADIAPMGTLADGVFHYVPPADLGFGSHELRVLVADRSGNAIPPAVWRFSVDDRTPPLLDDVRPDDGSSGSDRTPAISVAIDDAGTGLDPARISMTIDGTPVTSLATLSGGRLAYQPAQPLGFGEHVVVAQAADRAGNQSAPRAWRFTVRDESPPVVSDRVPVPGVTVAGATPIGFEVADAGTGVDWSSLQVMVDGSDVAAWGAVTGGRFRYAPGDLGAGVHTVAVTVADLAGNVTGPVMWQFAVADPARLDLVGVTAPASLLYGGHGVIAAVARANGAPLASAQVLLSSRPVGSATFGPARTLVASPTGEVRLTIAPGRTTVYRLELAASPDQAVTRTVAVRQRVTLAASSRLLRRGSALRLSGTVAPRHAGGRVAVQMLTRSGWHTVALRTLGVRSGYSATVVPRVAGRYVFRSVTGATAFNAAGQSATVVVMVR